MVEKCGQCVPNSSDFLHFFMLLGDLAFTFAEIYMRYVLAPGKRVKLHFSDQIWAQASNDHGKPVPLGLRALIWVFLWDVRDITEQKVVFIPLNAQHWASEEDKEESWTHRWTASSSVTGMWLVQSHKDLCSEGLAPVLVFLRAGVLNGLPVYYITIRV